MSNIFESFKGRFVHLKDDLIAGLIVAIVALPLAIGFAIASGVSPAMGIYAAVIGGLLAGLFGGSEFQISGPTGAMVVIILSVSAKYGIEGLILATFVAGVILLLLGIFKLGKVIEYIPYPVIVGFTAGIAFLLFFGQLNNFFGISVKYPAEAGFFTKIWLSLSAVNQANWFAVSLALITILILIFTPKFTKKIPGSIVAVALGLILVALFNNYLGLRTVGDVGLIPTSIPWPQLSISWKLVFAVLPGALTIAALAAIESLLSAVVADGMTGSKHNPNKELVGQGIANIGTSLFGGLPVTGAIARTATNIRNGGKTRLSAIFHAIVLLIIILLLGPIFTNIPLAIIAGILMFVGYNMVEWGLVFEIFRTPMSDVAIMITTFLIALLIDLTVAIEVGMVLASILFMKRMADLYKIDEVASPDQEGSSKFIQTFSHKDISIYTMNGPLFFGAAAKLDQELATTPGGHKPIKIIRMKYVNAIDATGMVALRSTIKKHRKMKGLVILSTVQPNVLRIMDEAGLIEELGRDHVFKNTNDALICALKFSHKMHGLKEEITKEEMDKYQLKQIEADDLHVIHLNDQDPVEKLLRSTKIHEVPKRAIEVSSKVNEVVKDAARAHKQRVDQTRKELIKTTPIKSRKLGNYDLKK